MFRFNSITRTALCGACLLVAFNMLTIPSVAQEFNSATLKKFVTPDVVGIGYIDLETVNLKETYELLGKLGFDEGIWFEQMRQGLPAINKEIETLKSAGISQAYALLRSSDIQNKGTSFVIPLKEGTDPGKAKEILESLLMKITGGTDKGFHYQAGFRDGALYTAEKENFERLKSEVADDNVDRSEMWKAIGGRSFGIVLFGDEEARKVVGELMPDLPGPFAKLNGELIAENTEWAAVSLKLDASPELNVQIEASNESSATVYKELIDDALKIAKFAPQVREVIPKAEIKFVFDAIAPKQDGKRISMSASKLTADLDRLAKVVAVPVKQVRKSAIRTQMHNLLRQHALAMLNYEATTKQFPPQYSADKEGKPLLSWRVHVLPFLDQNELYKQFKLDEPWDSPHNIKLAELMPAIYYDHRSGSAKLNDQGKTVFQVPAGEGLVFDGTKESGFRDLTDGSSNTILIAVVPQEEAVEWTKPSDWDVDLKQPLEKLKVGENEYLMAVLCDGSTHFFDFALPVDEFRKLIDPNDGEVIDLEYDSNGFIKD